MGGLDPTALGLMSNMNEDVLNQWRRSIEQGPLGGLGLPGSPLTPPTSSGPPVSSGRKTPTSPTLPRDPTDTPSNGRSSTPGQDENSNMSRATPVTNGAEGPKSEDGGASPPRAESKSPAAPKAESPSSPLAPLNLPNISTAAPFSLSTPTPSQLTASIAGHFPPLTNPMSLPLPLSVPPLMSTSRIPKSDPMEAKLQDMLRYNMEKFAGQPLDTLGKKTDLFFCQLLKLEIFHRNVSSCSRTFVHSQYRTKAVCQVRAGSVPRDRLGVVIQAQILGQIDRKRPGFLPKNARLGLR